MANEENKGYKEFMEFATLQISTNSASVFWMPINRTSRTRKYRRCGKQESASS